MKKILTLLVMFLATANILMAQTPQLNYQMIVRDKSNNLVVNTQVSGEVQVLTANSTNSPAVYVKNFTNVKTNMNGMLTILLDNQTNYTKLEEIDWTQSWFRVKISAYGIDTIMEVLPVVYAYKTFMKDNITTPRIVKYIKASTGDDVKAIDAAITGNESFINALSDSVANAMKRNPGMVKQLAIYFLGMVDPDDVDKAAKAVNQDVVVMVKDTVAKYIKNHRAGVYNILKEYIGETTVEDVDAMWNAAMQNGEKDEILNMIVDSVNKYIKDHPELATKTAQYIVRHLNADQVFALQNFTKNNNQRAYDTAKSILNSLIDTFMINNHYQKNQCNGKPIDLCELQAEIAKFAQYRDVECPKFDGEPSLYITGSNDTYFRTKIIHDVNFPLSVGDDYWYLVSFPNSVYPDTVLNAKLIEDVSDGTHYMWTKNPVPSHLLNREMYIVPKMAQPCKDLATYGDTLKYPCQGNCECPAIASFSYTSTAVADLSNYEGVQLTAMLTNSYRSDITYGFKVSVDGGNTWQTLKENPTRGYDGLTFYDTIKMNYCNQNILVKAYVTCGDNTSESATGEFKLRDLRLEVAPTSTNPVELIATNGIHISTQSYINEFHTEWPSVEQINAKYGATFGVNVDPEYQWYVLDGNSYSPIQDATNNNILENYDASKQYKVTCSFSIFNSDPCVLEATYPVQQ